MSLEYELKWNNFNTFTEDGERIIDMPPNKVLLQSSDEGVTGGYFDSQEQWHEFGGGGGDSKIVPSVTITFKNRTGQSVYAPANNIFIDGVLTEQGEDLIVETGEDVVYTTEVPYIREFGAILSVGGEDRIVEDMVNCETLTEDGGRYIKITNINEEASCTVTAPAEV